MVALIRKPAVSAGVALLAITGVYMMLGRDDRAATPADDGRPVGPLVPEALLPSDPAWFLMSNRLATREDNPPAVHLLGIALREPVTYPRRHPPKGVQESPLPAEPFSVGLDDGRVLLADEMPLITGGGTAAAKLYALLRATVPRSVSYQPGTEWELCITPSERFRLGAVSWRPLAVWSEEPRGWQARTSFTEEVARRISQALAMTRNVHLVRESRKWGLPDTYENAPARRYRTSWPPCKVTLDPPSRDQACVPRRLGSRLLHAD